MRLGKQPQSGLPALGIFWQAQPGMSDSTKAILLLGLGNDILTDDAVGLIMVRQLARDLAGRPEFEIKETMEMGLALLDFMVGYQAVVLVDSIQTGRQPPGTLHVVDPAGLKSLTGRTPHFLGVGETLALGRELGLAMPALVRIYAIEVEDPFTLGTELTPALRSAWPSLVDRITQGLNELAKQVLGDSADHS
jgi:hydrogenase maturation protease